MRTCDACGFENAEEGKGCSLCGASAIQQATLAGESSTLELPASASRSAPSQAIGQVYGDRYRVDAELGRGGMGRVYRVRDLKQDRELALKVLHPEEEARPERNARFKREIGILSKLQHPAIPRIHGWGTHDDELFFVTDLIDGPDLKAEIRRRGPWPPQEAASLAATVADALAAAHALGIVHRDVKSNNIMIASDGGVRLLDFGLARGGGIDVTTLTRTGAIVGTPGYMSPEQFEGSDVDERCDLYSLGVVLFELLTGRLPFAGHTPIAVALKHKTEPPPLPRSLQKDIPAWAERIVLRCLEKAPEARFASAAELASELRQPRSGRPQLHSLPSGDAVLEDDAGATDWALVLVAPAEKTGWSVGMALLFRERHYRLAEIVAPDASSRWTYRFERWPEGTVFRRLVDYEQDAGARAASKGDSLSSRVSQWLGKKP